MFLERLSINGKWIPRSGEDQLKETQEMHRYGSLQRRVTTSFPLCDFYLGGIEFAY